jgi:hypothetical protein
MDAVNHSLNAQNRASGKLARGELYLRRLELEKAQRDFEAAYETDTSPLSKLNLAQIYQVSGRLEEARLYAEDCLKGSDNSWMINFGIDPDRYKRDIHQILYRTYSGLAKTEHFLPRAKPQEKIRSLFKTISYKFKHAINYKLYQKYSLAAANAYRLEIFEGGGPHLDSFTQYYNAFEAYPRRALAYLNMARAFETSLIPAAIPSYDIEEGILLGNEGLVGKACDEFDPYWERELIAQCYAEFAAPKNPRLFTSRSRGGAHAAEELFALNRGALRQAGIALPVRTSLSLSEDAAPSKKTFERALAAAGFKDSGSRFVLTIKIDGTRSSGYSVLCELADSAGEVKNLRHSFPLRAMTRSEVYGFAGMLGNAVFTVE